MASTIDDKLEAARESVTRPGSAATDEGFGETYSLDLWGPFRTVLKPLASLKLSVVLFAFAIAIVLAGTFAQARMPLDDAIGTFFRIKPSELVQEGFPWIRPDRLFVWVPANTFLVPAFGFAEAPLSNRWGIALPKGWTVGLLMMINLLAAHIVRFKVQSEGTRLVSGLGVMAFGALVSWLVVLSGSSSNGLQETPIISYGTLWMMLKVSLFAISLASFYAAITMKSLVRVKRGLLAASGVVAAGACAWTLLGGQSAQLGDSDLRILYQLIKGLVAGLILLVGAWLAFGKRAGIVVIHLGVGLLMVSEVFVGLKAVETQMLIGEGETSNFLMDPSSVELAIIDHNHPDHPGEDVVIVIPQSMLVEGEVIDDERLPFTVAVDDYFPNIEWVRPSADNPATHGLGVDGVMMPGTRGIQVREAERIVGTDSRRDMPSAYVTVKEREDDDEQKIGTWLVSSVFDVPVPAREVPRTVVSGQFVPHGGRRSVGDRTPASQILCPV